MNVSKESDLAAQGMFLELNRIGYKDEGIRFIVASGSPYNYHSEIQLSRDDAKWIIMQLQNYLDSEESKNLR